MVILSQKMTQEPSCTTAGSGNSLTQMSHSLNILKYTVHIVEVQIMNGEKEPESKIVSRQSTSTEIQKPGLVVERHLIDSDGYFQQTTFVTPNVYDGPRSKGCSRSHLQIQPLQYVPPQRGTLMVMR